VLNLRAEYTGPQVDSVLCLSSWFMVNLHCLRSSIYVEGSTLVSIHFLSYDSFENLIEYDGMFVTELIIIYGLLVYVKFLHCIQMFTFFIVLLTEIMSSISPKSWPVSKTCCANFEL
jgi:hypothetical protein